MSNYNKLIGAILGPIIGLLVARNLIPAGLADQNVVDAMTLVLSTIVAVWASPANKPSA